MSSHLRIKKKCQLCDSGFIAKTTVTKFCSDTCSKIAYKAKKRAEKLQLAKKGLKRGNPVDRIQELQFKEILSVKETAAILSCSPKTVYRLIQNGTIRATNLGERLTRIQREEVDLIFNQKN